MPILNHIWHLICFLVVLLGPVPLCLTASVWAGCRRTTSLSHSLLVSMTWWAAIQCSIGIVLGATGWLRLNVLLVSEAVAFIAGIVLLRRTNGLASVLGPLATSRLRAIPDRREMMLLGALAGMAMILTWVAMTNPITEFDSLAYHLPQIAEWYQEGSLVPLPSMRQIARYPFNWEVLDALFVLPFGEDYVISLPNLCAWLMLGLGVYRLSTCLGASTLVALSAAGLCMSVPDVSFQVRTGLVDLALAAFFVVSLYFLCEYLRSRSRAHLPTFLAGLGVLLGTKTSGIVYAGILVFLLIVLRSTSMAGRKSEPEHANVEKGWSVRFAFAGVLTLMLLGGFWYARNLIALGNPLGFIPIRVAGIELLSGDEHYAELWRTTLASLFDLRSSADWSILWQALQAKWQVPFMMMAMQLIMLPAALCAPPRFGSKRSMLLMAGLVVACVLLYWHTPYTGDNGTHDWKITGWIANGLRYAIPLLGILAVTGALITTYIGFPGEPLIAMVIICCGLAITNHAGVEGLEILAAVFVVAWGAWSLRRLYSKPRARKTYAALLVASVAIVSLGLSYFARQERDANRLLAYRGVQRAIEREVPVGGRVGYLMSHKPYILYGRRLDRDVYFAPAGERDEAAWLRHLRKNGIRVLAVGPLRREFYHRKELAWLQADDGAFVRVFGAEASRGIVLYELRD